MHKKQKIPHSMVMTCVNEFLGQVDATKMQALDTRSYAQIHRCIVTKFRINNIIVSIEEDGRVVEIDTCTGLLMHKSLPQGQPPIQKFVQVGRDIYCYSNIRLNHDWSMLKSKGYQGYE